MINIKEKNKYKNNDILINDNNYYNINSINDNEDDKELFADTLITSYFNSNYSQIGNKK